MCGIFCIFNNKGTTFTNDFIKSQFDMGQPRGPESSKLNFEQETTIGFHRLAINGLDSESDQPICIDEVKVICNGEIYNYQDLYALMGIKPETNSDCEVIVHLYKRYGIEQTLNMLDGVFSFILFDESQSNQTLCYVARDPYGVRPLYALSHSPNSRQSIGTPTRKSDSYMSVCVMPSFIGFASELKSLIGFKKRLIDFQVTPFEPGTYSKYTKSRNEYPTRWQEEYENVRYTVPSIHSTITSPSDDMKYKYERYVGDIQIYLYNAVLKRVCVTDRPVACLLSGGLDSSLITALVNEIRKDVLKIDTPLETYSIGLKGASDLAYAKLVSDYLGTNHTEVIITENDYLNAIPEVIKNIESYDTTTVRASIGNYLIGKYISKHSDAKVIFNGDGSDELCGGYLYMHACKDPIEFDAESRRLLKNIHCFDVLRSDKCISSHGLEPRTPFLDRTWVNMYLNIHPETRCHGIKNECEKHLLRYSFSKEKYADYTGKPLLPDEILWRTKEAFSDGVSATTRSGFEIIQEYLDNRSSVKLFVSDVDWDTITHNVPTTIEQKFYRALFEKYYPHCGNVIPYFWMPKYIESKDSSARTLSIYKSVNSAAQHEESVKSVERCI